MKTAQNTLAFSAALELTGRQVGAFEILGVGYREPHSICKGIRLAGLGFHLTLSTPVGQVIIVASIGSDAMQRVAILEARDRTREIIQDLDGYDEIHNLALKVMLEMEEEILELEVANH